MLLGAVLGLFLTHAAFAAASHLLNDNDRANVSQGGWPQHGQAALVLGNGQAMASPQEQLTERQLLIPSGNNIAELLATVAAGHGLDVNESRPTGET